MTVKPTKPPEVSSCHIKNSRNKYRYCLYY